LLSSQGSVLVLATQFAVLQKEQTSGIIDTSDKLSPVSTTPVITESRDNNDAGNKFFASVIDTGEQRR
jgi:hypothetical protein